MGFVGEQWRVGTLGRTDRLDFQFSLDATSIVTGTWTNFDALDFTGPSTTGVIGLRVGSAAANRTGITSGTGGFDIPDLAPGMTIWFRWIDLDATGADDALAVDDFSLTAITSGVVGESQTVSISPATQSLLEGDAGSKTFTFTVARSGGTTGDLAFTANFAAGATDAADFLNGALPGPFGDTTIEANEAFTVALASVANSATAITTQIGASGGSAAATILNDDLATVSIGALQGEGHLPAPPPCDPHAR